MPDTAQHRDPLLDELMRLTAPSPTPAGRDPLLDELLGKLKRPVRDPLLDEVLEQPVRDSALDALLRETAPTPAAPVRDPRLDELLRSPVPPRPVPPAAAPITSRRQPAPATRPQQAPTEVGPARSLAEILDTRRAKALLQTILSAAHVYRDGRIELEFK